MRRVELFRLLCIYHFRVAWCDSLCLSRSRFSRLNTVMLAVLSRIEKNGKRLFSYCRFCVFFSDLFSFVFFFPLRRMSCLLLFHHHQHQHQQYHHRHHPRRPHCLHFVIAAYFQGL
jgi:hypothetical protein